MQNRLISILKYFLYWLLFFQAGRLLFFSITKVYASQFDLAVLMQSMLRGLWLDASMAGYFTLFLCLLHLGGLFAPIVFNRIFKIFHTVILVISCLAIVSNAVLYLYWATPLDFNALKYLQTPEEAAASINWWNMVLPIVLGVGLFFLFNVFFRWLKINLQPSKPKGVSNYVLQSVLLLFVGGLLIIPIRGGIGIVPVNLSYVYFHKENYPNQAAYNPVWNVLYSFAESGSENNYSFMEDELALKKFNSLFQINDSIEGNETFLKTAKPNIVVIVLESYLSKLVGLKYKGEEVIPSFNALTKSGIYFSNLYASGDRSDKGLVAIFSGYPAMPKSAIVQFPDKFSKLPSIFKDVMEADYSTSFYYGGNLDFANLRSYFISAGVQKIVSDKDLSSLYKRGKWGVHDEFILKHYADELQKMKQPFFSGVFTLSNHEPFDLPGKYYFGRQNGDEEYMSAARYTDNCLGTFIENLKKSNLWKNTLIVMVADHGVNRLGINEMQVIDKFHIPMVWTGGVIEKPQTVSKVCSQTDIPLLILNQCCIKPNIAYIYSNDIEKKGSKPFASYFFNNGFGLVGQNCMSIFDNVTQKYWTNTCSEDLNGVYGKAYLQVLSKDFTK
ncbi:MAG: LTA synthase family protein [Bacteroidia bacterium]